MGARPTASCLRTSMSLFRATRSPSSTHTGCSTFLHAILVIFNDFIHREINALGSLTLNGVVTHQPASCQHSYIGGGCPDSRSGTVGGEACVYICRQHSAGAVIPRPEERHMFCCVLFCSVFFYPCPACHQRRNFGVADATGVPRLRHSMVHK